MIVNTFYVKGERSYFSLLSFIVRNSSSERAFMRPMEYPAEAAEKPAATIAHPAALLALLMAFTNSGVTTC